MTEVDIYDAEAPLYDQIYDMTEDIPLYLEYAKTARKCVLECGVGTGRAAIPIARAGIPIVGIDINERMLSIARQKITNEPKDVQKRIKLFNADMRDFELEERFSVCMIPFNTFLHLLTVEDQEATLRAIHRHLLPKGLLIISVFNPDLTRPQNVIRLETVKQAKDKLLMRFYTQSFDFPNQTTTVQHIYDFVKSDGSVKRLVVSPLKLRYIFYDEMNYLLARTGYKTKMCMGMRRNLSSNQTVV